MTSTTELPPWLSRLYPFDRKIFLTPAGARMSFLDEGPRRDEAILLLHGNPTWSFFYRDLLKELAPHRRCVAPDHIGMGLSEKPADYDYRLERRIADIGGLIGSLGLRRVDLVLHDWGGAIGLGWAVRHPERVGRIVLLNTAAFPADWIPLRIALCRIPFLGEGLVRGLNGFARAATAMAMHRRRLDPEEKRGYLFPYDSWANRIGVHRFVADIPMESDHPSRALLEEIAGALPRLRAAPKLIVWGGRDFCFNDDFLRRWGEIFPEAAVRRLADAGHYVLDDGGAEARKMIVDFFARPAQITAGEKLEKRLGDETLRLNRGVAPKSSDIRPIA